ncbi:MAG: carboxypeptidase regulatory-like domain-containing protein, partial [Myxococcota bacterium]
MIDRLSSSLGVFPVAAGSRWLSPLAVILAAGLCAETAGAAGFFEGRVVDAHGAPVSGAMVTFAAGRPERATTVFTDAAGHYRTPSLAVEGRYRDRVRRVGWKDLAHRAEQAPPSGQGREVDFVLERETDPRAVAEQLPSNRWYGLLLERIDDPAMREELVRQCTFCHQQGSWATRVIRTSEEWQKVLSLMARMGAGLSPELRRQVPTLFSAAYDPQTAIARLTAHMNDPDFAPPPPPVVRRAVIDEWVVGHAASMQHDLMVHPNGRIYSVDMLQDALYELDPETGRRRSFRVPRGDLPLGGVFASANAPVPPNTNAHVGPHSIQAAPDGSIWI